jgi:hypothetical protein
MVLEEKRTLASWMLTAGGKSGCADEMVLEEKRRLASWMLTAGGSLAARMKWCWRRSGGWRAGC